MRLTIEKAALFAREDLTDSAKLLGAAIHDGIDPSTIGRSPRTLNRCKHALMDAGILTEEEGPATGGEADEKLDDDNIPALVDPKTSKDEVELIEFATADLLERDSRFRVFCQVTGADGRDAVLRTAWVNLENQPGNKGDEANPRGEGKVPIMAALMPVILFSAQVELDWNARNLSLVPNWGTWIEEEQFSDRRYNCKLGEDPPKSPEQFNRECQAEADQIAASIMDMGEKVIPQQGNEPGHAYLLRMQAVAPMAEKNARLGIGKAT